MSMTPQELWERRWSRRGKLAAASGGASRVPPEGMISFAFGDPDPPSLPLEDMVQAAESLAENNRRDALGYRGPIQTGELNEALAEKLARDQGIHVAPDQIMISNGGSGGLAMLSDMVLDPGDVVLHDAPAWMGATNMIRLAGAEGVGIPVDEDGIDPAKVEEALDKLEAEGKFPKFLYTIPTFQNPAGVELSNERRQALAKISDERGLLMVEDDAYNDLRFSGEKKPTIFSLAKNGHVLFFGTLSKTIAAGLRLGYMVGPADVVAAISRCHVDSLRNSYVAALADWFLRSGKLEEHIVELRAVYQEKCERMLAALDREMPEGVSWTRPHGGFFVWVTLPDSLDSLKLLQDCSANGVGYIPGPAFFSDGTSGHHNFRLSYSALDLDEIDEGIRRLGVQIKAALAKSKVAAPAD
ncbi:MAG TPA: PLP-dependent aminotransferase family protein [Thermomicrobiaceae bacterium]|nr:PLP-dependent aminotransferase family protein [Thermomicrobiaceae bacterium]